MYNLFAESSSATRTESYKRVSKLPSHLEDYFCNVNELNKDIPYPLSAYFSYDNISEEYKAYIYAVVLHPEPTFFPQANLLMNG